MHKSILAGTFVVFGNVERSFPRMVRAVKEVYDVLPQPVVIQAGTNLQAFHGLSGVKAFSTCDSTQFDAYVNSSSLLLVHGGVGATKLAIMAGRRPVVFVRRSDLGEHIDEHQSDWCNLLFGNNLAFNGEVIPKLLEFILQGDYEQKNFSVCANLFDDSKLKEVIQSEIASYLQC